jgi:tetratricopeptide (TPR) repeat protein
VPEQTPEARIRDLERRLDLDPGSRLFVSLAEEYRKVGRIKDALSSLQKGLLAHPGYVAAQVALGRVYVEAKQNTDAIATFAKVLQVDPGNLVAARSLADIYYDRGDNLEALKKFKLYRALSGDRKVDEIIAKIEPKVAPLPITPLKKMVKAEPPPPPSFQDTQRASQRPTMSRIPVPSSDLADPFDVTSLAFEPGEDSGKGAAMDGPFSSIPSRDTFIAPPTAKTTAPAAVAPEAPAPTTPPSAESGTALAPGAFEAAPASFVPAPPAPAEAAAVAPPAPSPEDLEETQSVRPSAPAPVFEPAEETAPEPGASMFASAPPAPPDLPEPPALFIAPSEAARAGEVEVDASAASSSRGSYEPREFPPPYDETPAQPPAPLEAAAAEPEGEPRAEAAAPNAAEEPVAPEDTTAPTGRALADLYYAQGHYAEALQIYDDLVTRHPFDADLQRMRRDAEARLLPAASSPAAASHDPGLERRLARVRALKRWLGRIQGPAPSAPASAPGP